MKTLLFTSFLIIGLAGGTVARAANYPIIEPGNHVVAKLVADHPTPEPGNKKVPSLFT